MSFHGKIHKFDPQLERVPMRTMEHAKRRWKKQHPLHLLRKRMLSLKNAQRIGIIAM